MSADEPGVIGITPRELLMEMRDDIRALCSVVDAVARDQALSVERLASMQRVADTVNARLDSHEKAIRVDQTDAVGRMPTAWHRAAGQG